MKYRHCVYLCIKYLICIKMCYKTFDCILNVYWQIKNLKKYILEQIEKRIYYICKKQSKRDIIFIIRRMLGIISYRNQRKYPDICLGFSQGTVVCSTFIPLEQSFLPPSDYE